MDDARLKSYLDGWAMTCCSTPQSVEAMIAGADPAIRFTDVNSENVHIGHDAIRHICALATGKYSDATVSYRDLLFDGRNWSIRWTFEAGREDGTKFSRRGASAGSVGEDGKVVEQTDYWCRG
jgi:hypothetical protein